MKQTLGMIEVKGFAEAIKVADVMAKVATITIVEVKITRGGGWMSVFIEGDVAAVQASIQAGEAEARSHDAFIASRVIARPIDNLDKYFLDSRHSSEKKLTPAKKKVELDQKKIKTVDSEKLKVEKGVENYQEDLLVTNTSEEEQKKEKTVPKKESANKSKKKTKKQEEE